MGGKRARCNFHGHLPQSGVASMLVLIAVAMATILSLGYLNAQDTSISVVQNVTSHAQARAIAESALDMTTAAIENDPNWRTTYSSGTWASDEPFAGGQFTVTVTDGDESGGDGDLADDGEDPVTITATGNYQGVTHTIRAVVREEAIRFTIDGGYVVPSDRYTGRITVLGASINAGGGYAMPVTVKLDVGGATMQPFGAFELPVDGNVNDNNNPRYYNLPGDYPADTAISAIARSWLKQDSSLSGDENSHWIPYMTVDARTGTPNVLVLRNGDAVPDIPGFDGQESLAHFIRGYIDTQTRRVVLGANEALYLFELGTSSLSSSAADFQDLVLLVSLVQAGGSSDGGTVSASGPGIAVSRTVTLDATTGVPLIDSYDSTVGPYGGLNRGGEALVATDSIQAEMIHVAAGTLRGDVKVGVGGNPHDVVTVSGDGLITGTLGTLTTALHIPVVTAPDLGESEGNYSVSSGTHTWDADRRFDRVRISGSAVVQVQGDVTVGAGEYLQLRNSAQLTILPDSSLTVYCDDDFIVKHSAIANGNTADPSRLQIRLLNSSQLVKLEDDGRLHAQVIAPQSEIYLIERSQFYGTFIGQDVLVYDDGQFHVDMAGLGGDAPQGEDDGSGGAGTGGDDGAVISVRWIERP